MMAPAHAPNASVVAVCRARRDHFVQIAFEFRDAFGATFALHRAILFRSQRRARDF